MTVPNDVRNHPQWPRLVELIRALAFLDGGHDEAFTLASGRHSRWFFDTKPVMMHPEAGALLGTMLNMRIKDHNARYVGGLELGAIPALLAKSQPCQKGVSLFLVLGLIVGSINADGYGKLSQGDAGIVADTRFKFLHIFFSKRIVTHGKLEKPVHHISAFG